MNYSGGCVWKIIQQWGVWVQNCSHGTVFQVEVEILHVACKITDWATRENHIRFYAGDQISGQYVVWNIPATF
jgi:hypothetical protein